MDRAGDTPRRCHAKTMVLLLLWVYIGFDQSEWRCTHEACLGQLRRIGRDYAFGLGLLRLVLSCAHSENGIHLGPC